jgi:hypothetical protein
MAPTSADPIALVRVILDRDAPGTTHAEGVGWILEVPHLQWRYLVEPDRPLRTSVHGPTLLRIDARADDAEKAEVMQVIAVANGHEVRVPFRGEPLIVPIAEDGDVSILARGGPATVALAERVPLRGAPPAEAPETEAAQAQPAPESARVVDVSVARVDLNDGGWRDVATASQRPLGWLEDRLGTLDVSSGAGAQSLREGTRATSPDSFVFGTATYRRRIEAPNLYTLVGVGGRVRNGPSSYGGTAGFYEDLDALRLRITGTADVTAQDIAGHTDATFTPRGFVEYSGRVTGDFFILPRLGYDGSYSTLAAPPRSADGVDDGVYNAFRFYRNTFGFLQALFWYVPYFNDIFYLRLRGTYDMGNGQVSHAAARPGVFLIFRPAELAAFIDTTFYAPTPGVRTTWGVDTLGSASFLWHAVVTPGSFEVRPFTSGAYRINDGGWQVSAGFSIVASRRRGVRDYSSLELEFPEETGGGVPWRSETRVGP